MRKRWLFGVAIVACAGLLVVALLPHRPPGAVRSKYDRIRLGMTKAEAEEILGGPPGDYTTNYPNGSYVAERYFYKWSNTGKVHYWMFDEAAVWILFRPDGTVEEIVFGAFVESSPPLLDRLKAWLGW
jgi:hypothetical protein